tara:strand:+ start:119 stop:439 length:321 start_codon:yes stop_codon:yes gene_type:complete
LERLTLNDTSHSTDEQYESTRGPRRAFTRSSPLNPPNLAELPDRILSLLRQSPLGEIEQNIKSLVTSSISKLDLVTREEFEVQQAMVEKLRARVEKLEEMLAERDK